MHITAIEQKEGYLEATIEGPFSAAQLKAIVAELSRSCTEKAAVRLLVNAVGLGSKPGLTVMDRYQVGQIFSDDLRQVRVVFLLQPEQVDPGGFGVLVAANRGMTANTFADRQDALRWLLSEA